MHRSLARVGVPGRTRHAPGQEQVSNAAHMAALTGCGIGCGIAVTSFTAVLFLVGKPSSQRYHVLYVLYYTIY